MGKQQTTDVSKKHEVGKGMIGPMATEGILLGQTRHQSRTPCCFATKTRFWNLNLPEKMGLLICFICFIELCFIICIYIYVVYQTNSGLYHETYEFADLNPVHCAFPAATASTKLSRVSSDKTIAGSWYFCQSLGVMALIYIVQLMSDVISNLDISSIMNNYIGYKLI